MTMIAVDCEFNGFGGELISMALVTEDGDKWYGVLPLPNVIDPWVLEHVVPVLHASPISREAFRASLDVFLSEQSNPEIVADWYTDLMHFFQCFEGEDHSQSMHVALRAELLPEMQWRPSDIPHNALHDAIAIMETVKQARAA